MKEVLFRYSERTVVKEVEVYGRDWFDIKSYFQACLDDFKVKIIIDEEISQQIMKHKSMLTTNFKSILE